LVSRRWPLIQYIKSLQDFSVVVSSNSTSKFQQCRSTKPRRDRKWGWVMLWRCLKCFHFLVILSRTANAATVDLKAELLLHLNFKAIVRGSILTSVLIGHVVRSRHSSPSVASLHAPVCVRPSPGTVKAFDRALAADTSPKDLTHQNTGSDPKVYYPPPCAHALWVQQNLPCVTYMCAGGGG